jgi:protein-disulfide isomerase
MLDRGGNQVATRTERRAEARAEREELQRAEALRERRKRRLWLVGASAIVAAVLVGIAISVSHSSSGPTSAGLAKDAQETNALLGGIPQQGLALGNPNAPFTLTEFADLQCPACREYTTKAFPTLVQRYVRSGKLRMVFRNLHFIGPDSIVAARAAGAAASQNRLWQFVDLFYKNQQDENSGYVRARFIRQIGAAASLDVVKLERDSTNAGVDQLITVANSQASHYGVKSTPSFLLGRTGQQPQRFKVSSLTPGAFEGKIDAALGT